MASSALACARCQPRLAWHPKGDTNSGWQLGRGDTEGWGAEDEEGEGAEEGQELEHSQVGRPRVARPEGQSSPRSSGTGRAAPRVPELGLGSAQTSLMPFGVASTSLPLWDAVTTGQVLLSQQPARPAPLWPLLVALAVALGRARTRGCRAGQARLFPRHGDTWLGVWECHTQPGAAGTRLARGCHCVWVPRLGSVCAQFVL